MALIDLRPQSKRHTAQSLVEHLDTFELDLNFSAGIWYMSPMSSRFHDKYKPDLDIAARLDAAAKLADYGLAAMEAHYPNEINEHNLDVWQKFVRDTGVRIVSIGPMVFYDAQFEFGSLSSPDEKVRRAAIARVIETLQLNRELDTDLSVVWTGIDGYENPFGIDFIAMRDRFAGGLAEAMDAVPGVRIGFEPKPYEPRGHHLYGTTPEGLLLAAKIESLLQNEENKKLLAQGHALAALNPEVGHMAMAGEDLPYAFSLVLEYGRLAHCHLNSQPLGNYDQDLNVGLIAPEQLEAALYAMKMHGYRGYFGIDINPERMPFEQAIRNSMDAVRAANERINRLDHEQVVWAIEHPDKARGWLEGYMIRMRAIRPGNLPPLPDLPRD